MAILTKDGTLNLLFPKGEEYSSMGDARFDGYPYNEDGIIPVDFAIVANWLCNAREITFELDYSNSLGSVEGYPITRVARRTKSPLGELDDEYPGTTLRGDDSWVISRTPFSTSRWRFEGEDDVDYDGIAYAGDLLRSFVLFDYHNGVWYRSKLLPLEIEPFKDRWATHTLTSDICEARVDHYDNDTPPKINTTRTYRIEITDTIYH